MSRVALVDGDSRVLIVEPDSGERKKITGYGDSHLWPVWSPDGKQIVFSAYSVVSDGLCRLRLMRHDLSELDAGVAFEGEPGSDAIAPRTPHYAIWSPDGRRIALMARNMLRKGLSLYIVDPAGGNATERFLDGAPLFVSWSPDSRFLLVHSRSEHFLINFQDDTHVKRLSYKSGLYGAPAWSPVGESFAVMHESPGGKQTLWLVNTTGEPVAELAQLDGPSAFAYSPKGDQLALLRGPIGQSRFFNERWVAPGSGGRERRLVGEPVFAFYWSPTGDRIAFVTVASGSDGVMRLGVVSVSSAMANYVADFQPTEEQITQFMFFDQYSQSHNPWSPDGRGMVFAGSLTKEYAKGVEANENPGVFLVNVAGEGGVRRLGDGVRGTWERG